MKNETDTKNITNAMCNFYTYFQRFLILLQTTSTPMNRQTSPSRRDFGVILGSFWGRVAALGGLL